MSIFSKLFGLNELSVLQERVNEINKLEAEIEAYSDEQILIESNKLKESIRSSSDINEALNSALPRAFALVRETGKRKLKQRHYDVQLIGGMVLHEGKIAEMLTGEGKTLTATSAVYLNALSGMGVHVITVNDYLAKRDAIWMGQIYHALGLTTSCIVHDSAYMYDPTYENTEADKERDELGSFRVVEKFLRPTTRREAYAADITYGTNHEFGFDYLRDNLVNVISERVQRSYYFAIIDEVDSILIDEARTPLIIAAPDSESSGYYKTFSHIAERLVPEEDYTVDEKLKTVSILESGIEKVEREMRIGNLYAPENARLVHFLQESVRAKALFHKDKEYVVRDGEIIIVDEFTGRMLQGRRYSGGLHQAIEAKEGVQVKQENRTYAQITIQNYFRLYKKIAGMTGTAQTSAEEFHKTYNLGVVSIPPNRPMVRDDIDDLIYKTKDAKYRAIAKEVRARHEKGQPVLIGTTSITNNETISAYLTEEGVPHEVLNAKNNEREGAIIAQAGKRGAVTVATNMAGRGVDIILGGIPFNKDLAEEIKALGGLHVIGTERHEARRIDNQLRGRAGRQGDPGSSQFFLSVEDDLMRIFGGDRIGSVMKMMNFPEDVPIESKIITKSVNQAQQKVEGNNFDIRKHLLEFDDVLNKQRTALYTRRTNILKAGEESTILPMVTDTINSFLAHYEKAIKHGTEHLGEEEYKKLEEAKALCSKIPTTLEKERAFIIGQQLIRILDTLWIEHLEHLESLRDTVNLRAYGQHEPIVEYRREAHILFERLLRAYEQFVFNSIFQIFEMDISNIELNKPAQKVVPPTESKDIGRNDPCYCGSGKKYKKCHGA
ncbi:preprotein translocase subunit SecA [Candidatus Parcubacteria bacterium]|jgi:preprotein translocase subunit SecA|nr:MAG: preprotein translocase subunit SecA [Candidatus Parcubacteria bacterium]